ncbi:sugar-binding domain-containing protein [Granulicella sp. S156]|uniref:glycosyl hydrolase 2 galactose-binding domain-containing protein n=1 Tax=Granulicella sp. S156 TaxID=1747224 RepID=UPI00352B2C18
MLLRSICLTFASACVGLSLASASTIGDTRNTNLDQGWQLHSGCDLNTSGSTIASTSFSPVRWLDTSVPSTVLAAQVAAGQYKDPYVARNLRAIPGTDYPIGANFANLPMAKESQYQCAWWYRKRFDMEKIAPGRVVWLHFDGINYRANIWINGKLLANSSKVAGAYRRYDFDATKVLLSGKPNVIAVETFAPSPTDLGVNWVDWSPAPPDKDMGITGAVYLKTTGPVSVRSPLVSTHFIDASLNTAELTVAGEFHNASMIPTHGIASVSLLGFNLQQTIDLAPGEEKTVVFAPKRYSQLIVQHPSIWWPYQMGKPQLQNLTLRYSDAAGLSDEQDAQFGIREMTSELTGKGYRLFRVNGKPILIRGGGWSQDMMLRVDSERLQKEFALIRDMHLNAIRLEGKLETDEFYRLADEQGILVMAGWSCCDQWEHWDKWTPENFDVAIASLRSQMLRLRIHSSLFAWLNGSDNPPPPKVEQAYLDIEHQTRWPNSILSNATKIRSDVSGDSGVKMSGPYDFVAPSYWLTDHDQYGGAYGFNTETGPGAAIPSIYSLEKFIPHDQLWPPNDVWSFHDGGGGFDNLDVFNAAMKATYGVPTSLHEYEQMSQVMAYDGERAMFEAYGRNKYTSTGVVQWMINNAWPSMIWHLYDYYLDAAGGYFGAKKACEMIHIQYSYDDHGIFVVNSRYEPTETMHASVHVYDIRSKQIFEQSADFGVTADSSTKVISIPDSLFSGNSRVLFVQLELRDNAGAVLSRNFYWVPTKLTEFDWSKTDYMKTPALHPELMTDLRNMPRVRIVAKLLPSTLAGAVTVQLSNPSDTLAFQLSVRALDKNGDAIDPVFWSDNYVTLMPNETRILTVHTWPHEQAAIGSLVVSGWNVDDTAVEVTAEKFEPRPH